MRHPLRRVRGIGFIAWHGRHMMYHIALGVLWAWYVMRILPATQGPVILVSVFGSLLPDAEHFLYFFTYGRKDVYTRQVRSFLRTRQWRYMTLFIEKGHKYNTRLHFHNIYVIGIMAGISYFSYQYALYGWMVLFSAMTIHYLFDIFDDLMTLGYLNRNWTQWLFG